MSVFDVINPLSNTTPKFTEEQLEETLKWFDDNAHPLLITDEGEPTNVVTIEQLLQFLDLKKYLQNIAESVHALYKNFKLTVLFVTDFIEEVFTTPLITRS